RLSDQMTSPVRWVESMERAAKDTDETVSFVEVGPGTVLAGLLRKILKGRRVMSLGAGEEVSAFLEQRR
ncbi:MAG: malonyl CoA-acyl carrier protein transacylase, partial [Gemmatimonadetes bacterium]|nr:malonyl CoA-acyl carrier protein transacylase [Gemmatimonadota bacterium]